MFPEKKYCQFIVAFSKRPLSNDELVTISCSKITLQLHCCVSLCMFESMYNVFVHVSVDVILNCLCYAMISLVYTCI